MRSALVALDLGLRLAGVDKAMAGQARAATAVGVPLDVFYVDADGTASTEAVRHLAYSPVLARLGRASRLVKMRLLASVRELDDYDVIFLRYPTAIDLDPLRLLRRSRARIVTIHHAKEVSEQLAVSRSPGTLARVALEWVQGRRILRAVDGVIGVTDEIRDYQASRAGGDVPSRTVSNGVDVDGIPATGFVPYAGGDLRIVLMSSSQAPWHGVDRLFAALRAHRGSRKIVLDMIGHGSAAAGTEERVGEASVVHHHGQLSGRGLDEVMRKANVGISTLAFFRTGLRQAAVLKTREYLARGLPTVIGYDDVDLREDLPFVLRVPNDDSPLSTEALFAFAERTASGRDVTRTIRDFAEKTLDWRVKVPLFTQFASEILDRPRRLASR